MGRVLSLQKITFFLIVTAVFFAFQNCARTELFPEDLMSLQTLTLPSTTDDSAEEYNVPKKIKDIRFQMISTNEVDDNSHISLGQNRYARVHTVRNGESQVSMSLKVQVFQEPSLLLAAQEFTLDDVYTDESAFVQWDIYHVRENADKSHNLILRRWAEREDGSRVGYKSFSFRTQIDSSNEITNTLQCEIAFDFENAPQFFGPENIVLQYVLNENERRTSAHLNNFNFQTCETSPIFAEPVQLPSHASQLNTFVTGLKKSSDGAIHLTGYRYTLESGTRSESFFMSISADASNKAQVNYQTIFANQPGVSGMNSVYMMSPDENTIYLSVAAYDLNKADGDFSGTYFYTSRDKGLTWSYKAYSSGSSWNKPLKISGHQFMACEGIFTGDHNRQLALSVFDGENLFQKTLVSVKGQCESLYGGTNGKFRLATSHFLLEENIRTSTLYSISIE